ncbi:MAG TPA: serine/threonine-protein kinase [Polyangiales bacterium]
MESASRLHAPRQRGRYAIYGQIGAGGMATVHFGRLLGPAGFTRAVAIKRLHPQFAADRDFTDMLIDEAHTASRIAHVNVVPTLDVIHEEGELWLVMDYVNGESLARLLDATPDRRLPASIAAALISGVLHGLHAAHETCNDRGELLGIVHRDVSPDNVLVGVDGVPRLLDFGVAKARGRSRTTPAGHVKGKLSYMPCEQLRGGDVDRRADVYAAGALLWEMLTGRILFDGASEGEVVTRVLNDRIEAPSRLNSQVPAALDRIVLQALARNRDERFATAREMANAVGAALRVASQSELVDWVQQVAGGRLAQRAGSLRTMVEPASATSSLAPNAPPTRGRIRTGMRWLGLALALAVLAGGYWLTRVPHGHPAIAPPPAVSAPEPAAVPPPPVEPSPVEPAPIEPPKSVSPEAVKDGPAARRRPRRTHAAPAKPPEVDCSQPYYVDAEGIRHVKRECL